MIAIVNYGAGNLNSVKKAFDYLGFAAAITGQAEHVGNADKIVLPGVGHFSALSALERAGLGGALREGIARGKPFLGICLGMQWLFEGSEEAPEFLGAGLIEGRCRRFPANVKSPHVGWNSFSQARESANGKLSTEKSKLLGDLPPESFVYFTHSFYAPITEATSATSDYGLPFSAAVEHDNIFGVQFHPEKSGAVGLQILGNFCRI